VAPGPVPRLDGEIVWSEVQYLCFIVKQYGTGSAVFYMGFSQYKLNGPWKALFRGIGYRGVKPKPGSIRIITFRVTTILQSKSNRCIRHTTFVICLLTRPGSPNMNKFP
jgi:hypothetical protein